MEPASLKPKVIAIFIAYRARKTLEAFYKNFPLHLVDEVILVDDKSDDGTFEFAQSLNIQSFQNPVNLGYGGNMKRSIDLALEHGADIIIDIHPDGEYKPSAIPAALVKATEGASMVLGNRMGSFAAMRASGMFAWKILPIVALNLFDRVLLGVTVHDLHQGFRVYTKRLLETCDYHANSNNYLFSFELIAQAAFHKLPIAEVPVETEYSGEKRGASLKSSVKYALGTFKVLGLFFLSRAFGAEGIFKKRS